ncbi:MAG: glycoside hydrolase family 127 protein [Anaerolineae bacterium]
MTNPTRRLTPVSFRHVSLQGSFWERPQETNRRVTLPVEYELLQKTGRIGALRLDWQPGQPHMPHHFWDSDIAKWIEAAGYSLATHPDPELEQAVDGVIELLAASQQPDGYLNTHYSAVEPQNRWTNLRDMHELYCAGHLMEAGVAYYEGTGKRQLLDVMCRYADYIDTVFGPHEGQKRGYPGHEEIELALVKLARVTGEARYLRLAEFFVDERGRQPHYYDIEAIARGEDPKKYYGGSYAYCQSHLPVREQTTAEGHAVRAVYLYSGMADVAAETGDDTLVAACERLWANVTERRMYVTGGIGPAATLERFTYDYDLPNDNAYAETCAAIGLVFWAHRMLHIDGDGRYADTMELALYNGVLSGVSLDGTRFFYANPLEVDPAAYAGRPDLFHRGSVAPQRQKWFDCACCPPNVARLLAALGEYAYSTGAGEAAVHLYAAGEARLTVDGQAVTLRQETRYPWDGRVRVTVGPERAATWTLALRIPAWCRSASLWVNGEPVEAPRRKGYARITRSWQAGDVVDLDLAMPVERMAAHPKVREDAGRVALQRGPLVYCLEELDNGPVLPDIALPRNAALEAHWEEGLLGGVVVLEGPAERRDLTGWEGQLYRATALASRAVTLRAVPYYAWGNRGLGEMLVWLREV